MRSHLLCSAAGAALIAGISVAHAQTVMTRDFAAGTVVTEPVRTVETVTTVRTVRPVRHHVWHRRVTRSRTATITTTRRTIVRERLPAEAVIVPSPAPPPAIAGPTYTEVVQPELAPGYRRPIYDVVTPSPDAVPPPIAAAPYAQIPLGAGAPVIANPVPYRYVYESDRILVIDPYTNIAVQAIPR